MNVAKRFSNLVEFTDWLLSQPESVEKKITLRNIYKIQESTIEPSFDASRGEWLGGVMEPERIPESLKREGVYVPTPDSRVVLKEGVTFDLTNPVQLANWNWVKYDSSIVLTEAQARSARKGTGIMFYVDLPEYDATIRLGDFEAKKKAFDLIDSLAIEDYKIALANLGINGQDHLSPTQMKEYLYSKADRNAEEARKVIKAISSQDFRLVGLRVDALRQGIIRKEGSTYTYGEIVLGYSEERVTDFLRDPANKGVVASIMADTEAKSPTVSKRGRKPQEQVS